MPDTSSSFPYLEHHGGARGVTGSCHRLQVSADRALLVDCGLFQGQDADHVDSFEQLKVTFPVADVLALVVTHVHIDHIGRLPYLLAAGYGGPIICSLPSSRLLPLVIEDALKIGFTRDRQGGRAQRTLFSGDLGAPYAPLLPAPKSPWGCDTLVLESTYGDRRHEDRCHRRAQGRERNPESGTGPHFSCGYQNRHVPALRRSGE